MKGRLLLYVLLICLAVNIGDGFCKGRVYHVSYLEEKPLLDGKVCEASWEKLAWAGDFIRLGTDSLAAKQTRFKVGYRAEGLYIGIECKEPEIDKVRAKEQSKKSEIWERESIEIFIMPLGSDDYFQFVVDVFGSHWLGKGQGMVMRPIKSSWVSASLIGEDSWSVEVNIPFETLGKIPENGEEWGFNICRNTYISPDKHSSWAHVKVTFHEHGNFAKIRFSDKMPNEDVLKITKNLVRNYSEKLNSVEAAILFWKEKDQAFFVDLKPFLEELDKVRCDIQNLDALSFDETKRLFGEVMNIIRVPFRIDELRKSYLLEKMFSE